MGLNGKRYSAAFIACLLAVALVLPGCPPFRFEDVYGYNTVILVNRGDRAILAFYVIGSDEPGRGWNYIEQEGGLQPGRSAIVGGLTNDVYTLEIEYLLTPEELGLNDPDAQPERHVESLSDVSLFWGAIYQWPWYGPEDL